MIGFGMVVGIFLGLGMALFFRWSEDSRGLGFLEWLDARGRWVRLRNEGETTQGFDVWLLGQEEE